MLRSPRVLAHNVPRTLTTVRTAPAFPVRADAVVVGAGPAGAATAYHLTRQGMSHVLLLDHRALPSCSNAPQGTPMLAPRLLSSDSELVRLTRDLAAECQDALPDLESGVGKRPSLILASSPARAVELERLHAMAQYHSIQSELLTPRSVKTRFPLIQVNDLELALLLPDDAIFDPDQFSFAVAEAAARLGAQVHLGIGVQEILVRDGKVEGVRTPHGIVQTQVVVCAAGTSSKEMCKPIGVDLPFLTSSTWGAVAQKGIEQFELPSLTDLDSSISLASHKGYLHLQGNSPSPIFSNKPVSSDLIWKHTRERKALLKSHLNRLPFLMDTLIKQASRIESSTPDRRSLFGESPKVRGLYLNCGFNSRNLALSGGLGKELASLIVDGNTSLSLFHCDIRRFLPTYSEDPQWLTETTTESHFKTVSQPLPLDQPLAGRGQIKSPFHQKFLRYNPFNGVINGYERALFYLPNQSQPVLPSPYDTNKPEASSHYKEFLQSLREPEGQAIVKEALQGEVKECRNNVVVFDQSSFGKLWLRGPDSLQALEWMCSNKVSRPIGSIVYTLMLNERAGIEGDVTVTRLSDTDFLIVTGAPFRQYNLSFFQKEIIRQGFNCHLSDVTEDFGVLNLQGPKSRHVLSSLTDSDISNEALPYMQCKQINIGETKNILTQRMTFAGELGFEMYIPKKDCDKIFDKVMATGVRPAGMATLNLLSIEKGFKHWGGDINCEDTPFEAGLGFVCKLKSGIPFKGREELLRLKAIGPSKRLRGFEVPPSVSLSGGELIYRNGEVRGLVRRTGRSFTCDSTIAYGYIQDPEHESTSLDYVKNGDYAIEVRGKLHKARGFGGALYDSKGLRAKE